MNSQTIAPPVDGTQERRQAERRNGSAPNIRFDGNHNGHHNGHHDGHEGDGGSMEIPAALNLSRDQVRWGPIVAGLVTALTTMLLLNLLGIALGLTAVDAAGTAQRGAAPEGAGTMAAIWAGISAIIGFFSGGWVAGKTAAVFSRGAGAFNGAMVFLLAVPVTLWLASAGLGALLGSLGSFAGAMNIDPAQAQNAAQSAFGQAQQAAGDASRSEVTNAAQTAKTVAASGAWGALIASLLGLGAATLGGSIGTRRHVDKEDLTSK